MTDGELGKRGGATSSGGRFVLRGLGRLLLLVVALFAFCLCAGCLGMVAERQEGEAWWRYGVEANVLQFDGFPSHRGDYNLAGLELKGFDVSHEVGKLYGVGLYGLGGALESTGVTVAALSSTWRLRGAQVSFLGGLVYSSLAGLQCAGGITCSGGGGMGMQLALLGNLIVPHDFSCTVGAQCATVNVAYHFSGLQAGVWNYACSFSGVQFGIVNVVESDHGLQLGLLDFREDTWWPLPLIRW